MQLDWTSADLRFDPEVYAERQDGLEGFYWLPGIYVLIFGRFGWLHRHVLDEMANIFLFNSF